MGTYRVCVFCRRAKNVSHLCYDRRRRCRDNRDVGRCHSLFGWCAVGQDGPQGRHHGVWVCRATTETRVCGGALARPACHQLAPVRDMQEGVLIQGVGAHVGQRAKRQQGSLQDEFDGSERHERNDWPVRAGQLHHMAGVHVPLYRNAAEPRPSWAVRRGRLLCASNGKRTTHHRRPSKDETTLVAVFQYLGSARSLH